MRETVKHDIYQRGRVSGTGPASRRSGILKLKLYRDLKGILLLLIQMNQPLNC